MLPTLLAAPVPQGAKKTSSKGEYFVYVGTYARQDSKGIYAYRFQPATGRFTSIGLAAALFYHNVTYIGPQNQDFRDVLGAVRSK